MGWLEDKLAKWRSGIAVAVGEEAASYITAGGEGLAEMTPVDRAGWTAGVLERFAERVPDEALRRKLLTGFSCSYLEEVELGLGPEPLERMRALYRETGDLDAVLEAMRAANIAEKRNVYPPYERSGNTIIITKRPRDPEGVAKATNKLERRQAACYCPLAAAAPEPLAPEYLSLIHI